MNVLLEKLYAGQPLTMAETKSIFADIFAGKLDPLVFSSLLTALKMNGYTADEIGGAATAMLEAAEPFERDPSVNAGEIVGTGGDRLATINISTMAGLVCGALGLKVAKHGNTAVSSKAGASDMLSVLGYNIRCDQKLSRINLEQHGFAFLFAQFYHKGMRFAAPVRKALGTSTIFNILGPLTNPAHVGYELMGCYDPKLLNMLAKALHLTGVKRAMVINGNGMDEISIFGTTKYSEIFPDGHTEDGELTPQDFGIKGTFNQDDLKGGTAEENAEVAKAVLSGKGKPAHNAVVAANAAAMLRLAGAEDSLARGYEMAMDSMASGKPYEVLQKVCAVSRGE